MTSDILVRMRRSEKCGKTYEYRFETASVTESVNGAARVDSRRQRQPDLPGLQL